MHHPQVAGNYYEMGFNYGIILYKHRFRLPQQSSERLAFGKECENEVKRVFPEVLDEIHGFADACHMPYERLGALVLGVGAFKPPVACSVFTTAGAQDVLFARNYDFYYSFAERSESYLTRPSNGYSSIGNTDIFVGREDGVNETGLAIGMTAVRPMQVRPGINFALLVRYILDKCSTAKEAVKTLTTARHVTANNYLVVDRDGNMVVIEACPDRVSMREPEEKDRFIVCTNHFVLKSMRDMERLEERPSDSTGRYDTICERLRRTKRRLSVLEAQRILSDHEGKVCSHIEEIQLGTLWSIVATLKKPSIYMAEGHPCKTEYRPETRLTKSVSN